MRAINPIVDRKKTEEEGEIETEKKGEERGQGQDTLKDPLLMTYFLHLGFNFLVLRYNPGSTYFMDTICIRAKVVWSEYDHNISSLPYLLGHKVLCAS